MGFVFLMLKGRVGKKDRLVKKDLAFRRSLEGEVIPP